MQGYMLNTGCINLVSGHARDISLLAALFCLLFQLTNFETHSAMDLSGVFHLKIGIIKSLDPYLQGDGCDSIDDKQD